MFKKTFAAALFALALFASAPASTNMIDPVPGCLPCDIR